MIYIYGHLVIIPAVTVVYPYFSSFHREHFPEDQAPSLVFLADEAKLAVVAGAEHQLRMIFRVNRPVRVEGPGFMMVAVEAAAVEGIHFIVGHEFSPRGVYALVAGLGAEELAAGRIVDDLHRVMLVP